MAPWRARALFVIALVSGAPATLAADVPVVRVIATGGTIANRGSTRLGVDDLLRGIPNANEFVRAEAEQFSNVASAALTLNQWLQLSRRINDIFRERRDLAGIVVTAGTDTLEEVAYFLHLTVKDERPVVLVASMRAPDTPGYDGAVNLVQGLRVAAEPASRGKGVLVVLGGEIHSAREVVKTETGGSQPFQAPGGGLLGLVDDQRVTYVRASVKRHTITSEFDVEAIGALPRVDVIMAYQGAPGDLILASADAGAKGIVMAGAGAGTAAVTQREALVSVVARKIVLVMSSRTGSGRVGMPPEGIGWLGPLGPSYAAFAEDLPPLKARVLLMLALTKTSDGRDIQRMFTEY
jgi:L-asparaginase type II